MEWGGGGPSARACRKFLKGESGAKMFEATWLREKKGKERIHTLPHRAGYWKRLLRLAANAEAGNNDLEARKTLSGLVVL